MSDSRYNTAARGVIVTGGGTGIGRATAQGFAEQGDQVLVVGRTERTLAETALDRPNIRTLAVDITDPGAAEVIVSTALREFGRLDVLVNNAGIAVPAPVGQIDRRSATEQLEVNLLAPIFLTQQALPALAETNGTVVNLSSAGSLGRRAWPYLSIYGAGKVAIDFLTRTWAVEFAPRGVRVVAVAAGVIATGMGIRSGSTPQEYEGFLAQISKLAPLGRVGQPEEIAWWVRQLTDPAAGYATGTVLAVDGGLSVT
ncbi:SDR family NAD(P)-dependent oxidoreductase [Micromonospora halophytica]|uniref:SDR family NAD(P)-dependent oxidoreductase n=1 Tax=Micromonospora halophytica TaxID=47864 RepID=UPI001FE09A29|nr:SDR family oxidoreductase [Micromonospora halophytica]